MKEEQNNISRVLGQKVDYPTTYDKSILVREERQTNRSKVKLIDEDLPFVGFDTWNAYEFTCLQDNGIPVAGLLKLVYSCNSKYIVESKSLKLYLNSFNFYKCGKCKYDCFDTASEIIKKDLSELLETQVSVCIFDCNYVGNAVNNTNNDRNNCTSCWSTSATDNTIHWQLLNEMFEMNKNCDYPNAEYVEDPSLLKLSKGIATTPQAYWCNTLFSRCKVTKQPDHGDIYIYYNGDKVLDPTSLLQYITSIRNECHFHEEICETIYKRLYDLLDKPRDLFVGCLYVRRGGIDINPMRASNNTLLDKIACKLKCVLIPYEKSMKQ